MKALLQRVSHASVSVNGDTVGKITQGFLVLLGVAQGDSEKDARYLADRVAGLRIFSDEASKFNLSLKDVNGEVLVVSQFTLLADTKKGRRPSFTNAAPPDIAEPLVETFIGALEEQGFKVEKGRFGAHMHLEIHNDGPVTLMLESRGS
jgi:D-tyrosyl-tRNA(Tyr) deacylase